MSARVSLHAPIRWGATEVKNITVDPVLGIKIVSVPHFVDLKLALGPQQLSLALYALTAAPIAGVAVEWHVGLGTGSTNIEEVFSTPASDVLQQVPIVLQRPAMSVQIAANISATFAGTKDVKLVALVAPTSPTWLTDIGCIVPVKEG
jgi:hypothetical protein